MGNSTNNDYFEINNNNININTPINQKMTVNLSKNYYFILIFGNNKFIVNNLIFMSIENK